MGFAHGDVRVAARGEWLLERMIATGSVVVRKLGGTRAGEMAVHRFLSSPYVSVSSIVQTLAARTAAAASGRRIVAIQDTSEINFKDRAAGRRGFGPAGNGRDPGFFLHPVVAVDADSETVLGLVGAHIWTRDGTKAAPRRGRALADKESQRWLDGCATAASALAEAASVTMVADRESDIFELFAQRPEGLELIVRAAQDRRLADGGSLFAALDEAVVLDRRPVRVEPRRPGGRARTAIVELKAGRVRLARPGNRPRRAGLPDDVEVTLVEAREVGAPDPDTALCWRLLTTTPVATAEEAAAVVGCYRLRWRIEQVFRALKSDGLRLDDAQLAEAERLFNLAAMALAAAVRTIQLVDARDGSPRPATDVLDPEFMNGLERLSRSLEGNTARQKNPHPKGSLAFVAWVAARLGGWNCYGKPPGPKTMRAGWNELAATLGGFLLATRNANP
jgi:hypothetical protein